MNRLTPSSAFLVNENGQASLRPENVEPTVANLAMTPLHALLHDNSSLVNRLTPGSAFLLNENGHAFLRSEIVEPTVANPAMTPVARLVTPVRSQQSTFVG